MGGPKCDMVALSAIGVVDSMGASAHVVGSSLSLRSVWEAKNVIGVVDSAMGRLQCDRGRRFYRAPAQPS